MAFILRFLDCRIPHRRRGGHIGEDRIATGEAREFPARAGDAADGLTCRIMRHGAQFARTSDPQANTGRWVDIVCHVANVLAAFGERLRTGEVIITGSVVPPIAIEPDENELAFALDPVGAISVNFSR